MKTIIRYTLLTASRDWLFIGLAALVLMAYAMSVFTGSTALVEQLQMSLAYFAGASRIILVAGIIIFICFHVRRSFENREIELILSKPISRTQFVIAYWLGFVILSLVAILPVLFILYFLNDPNPIGLLYWGISLVFEISIISAFALLSALIMKSAVSCVMSTFTFYLACRLMGFFTTALGSSTSLSTKGSWGSVMEFIMQIISTIIPRLDLFAKSQWLIYGVEGQNDLWIFPVQSLIYILLILSVAIFDFKRKEF